MPPVPRGLVRSASQSTLDTLSPLPSKRTPFGSTLRELEGAAGDMSLSPSFASKLSSKFRRKHDALAAASPRTYSSHRHRPRVLSIKDGNTTEMPPTVSLLDVPLSDDTGTVHVIFTMSRMLFDVQTFTMSRAVLVCRCESRLISPLFVFDEIRIAKKR